MKLVTSNARAVLRGAALLALTPVKVLLAAAHAIAILAACVGMIFVFPPVFDRSRWMATLARRLAGQWSAAPAAEPYRPRPRPTEPSADGLYRSRYGRPFRSARVPDFQQHSHWIWTDPATWRDIGWLLADPVVGSVIAGLPAALLAYGVASLFLSWQWILGVPAAVAGWLVAPALLRLHGRWTRFMIGPATPAAAARGAAWRRWFGRCLLATLRSAAFLVGSLVALVVLAAAVVVLVFTGPLVAVRLLVAVRPLPDFFRRYAGVPRPYGPAPQTVRTASWWTDFASVSRAYAEDPATWRDLFWLACQPVIGCLLNLPPVALIGYGGWGLFFPSFAMFFGSRPQPFYGELFGSSWLAMTIGLVLVIAGFAATPVIQRLHTRWLTVLLAPTASARLFAEREQLAARVEQLTETRTAATDTQAAELRRIERDLHDGTQARLVAMGMTLGAVEALIDRDPAAAKKLVAQLRETSATALAELRSLVRGIHPPVLAERGLVDAIRAVALDTPLAVRVEADLDGHAEPPLEAAAYFAVVELLTNAVRHSGASEVRIDIEHHDGELRISVRDNGKGGADPDIGTGLRGIQRRLGPFDGRVTVSSPLGGPTLVTLELPCVLFSPRTSTSSETA
ncbi:sensor histidine kinase [Fodinicola acaciae]|uniref:sensor histidine kinase n=1 Tax=Fodinicola acaciae TaxID=2681555 RepID=UPI0013D2CDDE|nr:sensor histidine kinase [Fodinicola acaciae]